MINLITGATGSGKSAFCMSELLQLIEQGRPLYVHGVPNLKIPHILVVCSNPLCAVCPQPPVKPIDPIKPAYDAMDIELKQYSIDLYNYNSVLDTYLYDLAEYDKHYKADEWHLWAANGALVILDEVQFVYPPTSSSAKKKDSVALFATHRHKGIDFYIMTQTPLLFDRNVKLLCGKHIHLRSTWAGRFQYEFDQVQDNVKSLGAGVRSTYKLNKKVFDLYKSSSLHTKQIRKVPMAFYAVFVLIFLLGFLGYRIKSRSDEIRNPEQLVLEETQANINDDIIPNTLLTERVLTAVIVSSWASLGVPVSDYDLVPSMCSIGNKTVKCPPYSIPNDFYVGLNVDKYCISSKTACTYLFKKALVKGRNIAHANSIFNKTNSSVTQQS